MHVERLSVWSLVRLSILLREECGRYCLCEMPFICNMVKTDVCHSLFRFA